MEDYQREVVARVDGHGVRLGAIQGEREARREGMLPGAAIDGVVRAGRVLAGGEQGVAIEADPSGVMG